MAKIHCGGKYFAVAVLCSSHRRTVRESLSSVAVGRREREKQECRKLNHGSWLDWGGAWADAMGGWGARRGRSVVAGIDPCEQQGTAGRSAVVKR